MIYIRRKGEIPVKTVLVSLPIEERHKKTLEAAGPECRFVYCGMNGATAELVRQADIILGCVPADMIQASPRLGLLQLYSAGTDPYIVPGVLDANTILTNATGAYGKAVGEHAFAMTLTLQKKLHRYRDAQRERRWADFGQVCSLSDCTVLVVGLGDIGRHYARLCKAMGAFVIGVKRRPGACPEGVDELCRTEELDSVLPRADVVASFLPGTDATRALYTAERFAAMKDSAVFINCGRGSAVRTQVLIDALAGGQIAAAGIDVCETEPLPADSPLWTLDNLLLTPHVSGNFHLPDILEKIVELSADNLRAYLAGRPLRNVVDFETGYRK